MQKYKPTKETTHSSNGKVLYRIQATKDFPTLNGLVKKGDLGGFVENKGNLSHKGGCWVFDNSKVYGKYTLCDNAIIIHGAEIGD